MQNWECYMKKFITPAKTKKCQKIFKNNQKMAESQKIVNTKNLITNYQSNNLTHLSFYIKSR